MKHKVIRYHALFDFVLYYIALPSLAVCSASLTDLTASVANLIPKIVSSAAFSQTADHFCFDDIAVGYFHEADNSKYAALLISQ